MKFSSYIVERGGRVFNIQALECPQEEWASALEVFKDLCMSGYVHQADHRLMDLAVAEKDNESQVFHQWFVHRTGPGRPSCDRIVKKLEIDRRKQATAVQLDKELGKRRDSRSPDYLTMWVGVSLSRSLVFCSFFIQGGQPWTLDGPRACLL